MPKNVFVLQSEIERLTGFGIEQLRKWRQRFGFPPAQYDASGGAVYARESVDRLLVIKRLLEAGRRPGQIVGRTAAENLKMVDELNLLKPDVGRSDSINALIRLLNQHPSRRSRFSYSPCPRWEPIFPRTVCNWRPQNAKPMWWR
jgi:hypothetical protein